MNAFEAEVFKQQVQDLLSNSGSPRQKLILLKNYYSILISDSPRIIAEAYVNEFLDEFLISINLYEVYYFRPQLTEGIVALLREIKQFQLNEKTIETIDGLIYSLNIKLNQLNHILNGNDIILNGQQKVFFPLLEKDLKEQQRYLVGTLETFTIDIKKNNNEDNFLIIPSSEIIDELLLSQINISWQIAINYIKRHILRLNKYHKVIIHFDHRWGNYSGSSLGAALTISFIEELIKFYNLSFIISIKENIALTGGFDENGSFNQLNEIVIERKLEIVFYSFIKIFIVPEENKIFVRKKMDNLKQLYPNRKLQIIGITDLQDLLNRRNLIDIRKQSPIVRTTKYARKNWLVSLLFLALLLLTGYFYEFNYDDNPEILNRKGRTLFVENKSGKVLFTKTFADEGQEFPSSSFLKSYQLLVDVNNNGIKNLILAGEQQDSLKNGNQYGGITCYDHKGNALWNYLFHDTISSPGEVLSQNYASYLIDTSTVRNKKVLISFCCNKESFGSAIYMLDLKSGKRVFDTFWHPGFINGGYVIESKNLKEKDLVFEGGNNSWHKIAIGMLALNNIDGKAPSDRHHDYYGNKIASLKYYILLPNEDYQKIILPIETLFSSIGDFLYSARDNSFDCNVYINYKKIGGVVYCVSKDFNRITIIINDDYVRLRDPYVKSGKLKPPLSDTQEYRNLLISQVLYWNGKKFVKKDKLN
ncbi:MAG: hypothetical protein M1480_19135 [Bacteroidetes bacterium]|nr:hypothetical protein [Bacteroidota bacterium]